MKYLKLLVLLCCVVAAATLASAATNNHPVVPTIPSVQSDFITPAAIADGGPIPMCPPSRGPCCAGCGPTWCPCPKVTEGGQMTTCAIRENVLALHLALRPFESYQPAPSAMLPDGSDPMPLCRPGPNCPKP